VELVPNGPVAVRLCRYAGLNDPLRLALARSRIVTQRVLVAHLAQELDTLPPFPTRHPPHCPSDDGSQIVALFAYAGSQHLTVAFDRTGCNLVTNGDLARIGDTPVGRNLNTELWRLTAPAAGSAHVTGLVRLCGGLAPGHCFTQNGAVGVLDTAGEVVATQATTRASFSFSLPPGTYSLVATTGRATGRQTVTLIAGRRVHSNIVVPIR
jgi:hypothetical protein